VEDETAGDSFGDKEGRAGCDEALDALRGENEEDSQARPAAADPSDDTMAVKMLQFLDKAVSSKAFPEGIEDYVKKHRHDVAEEDYWRVELTKQVDNVLFGLTKQLTELKKSMDRPKQQKAVSVLGRMDSDDIHTPPVLDNSLSLAFAPSLAQVLA